MKEIPSTLFPAHIQRLFFWHVSATATRGCQAEVAPLAQNPTNLEEVSVRDWTGENGSSNR